MNPVFLHRTYEYQMAYGYPVNELGKLTQFSIRQ